MSLSSLRSPNDDLSEGKTSFLCALDAQVERGFQSCDLGFCWTFNHCGNDGHTGDLHAAIGTPGRDVQAGKNQLKLTVPCSPCGRVLPGAF